MISLPELIAESDLHVMFAQAGKRAYIEIPFPGNHATDDPPMVWVIQWEDQLNSWCINEINEAGHWTTNTTVATFLDGIIWVAAWFQQFNPTAGDLPE